MPSWPDSDQAHGVPVNPEPPRTHLAASAVAALLCPFRSEGACSCGGGSVRQERESFLTRPTQDADCGHCWRLLAGGSSRLCGHGAPLTAPSSSLSLLPRGPWEVVPALGGVFLWLCQDEGSPELLYPKGCCLPWSPSTTVTSPWLGRAALTLTSTLGESEILLALLIQGSTSALLLHKFPWHKRHLKAKALQVWLLPGVIR